MKEFLNSVTVRYMKINISQDLKFRGSHPIDRLCLSIIALEQWGFGIV